MTGTSAVAMQTGSQAVATRTDSVPQERQGEDPRFGTRDQGQGQMKGRSERSLEEWSSLEGGQDRDSEEKQIQAEARAKAIAKYKEWLEKKKQASLEKKRSTGEKDQGEKLPREKLKREKSEGEKKFPDQR
jgi:hypothetical protein